MMDDRKLATTLAALLMAIVEMSDDVVKAASPLDAQGKLLRMQKSIQTNKARMMPHLVDPGKRIRS